MAEVVVVTMAVVSIAVAAIMTVIVSMIVVVVALAVSGRKANRCSQYRYKRPSRNFGYG